MGILDALFGPPRRGTFARRMAEAVCRDGAAPARILEDSFALDMGGGRPYPLGDAYDEYCSAPRPQRDAVLARHADRARGMRIVLPADYAAAAPGLRPVLRGRFDLEFRRLRGELEGTGAPALPARTVADDLVVTLAWNGAEVDEEALRRWDVAPDTAFDRARENLWNASRERLEELAPGLWISPWRDGFDAARLVLHDLVWQYPVKGRHVAAAPDAATLLVTGSEDAEGLARLGIVAERALREAEPTGTLPVALQESRWTAFPAAPLGRLAALTAEHVANAQKALLDRLLPKRGDPTFVATCTAAQHPGSGQVSLYSTWTEGLPTLLPKTDQVAFVRPEEKGVSVTAPWERVVAVCGGLMSPQRMVPERWKVARFPTAEQRERLRATSGP